jgi:uncharacterized protein (UPF0147 family)
MGFSFAGIQKELDSEPFRKLYQELRISCTHLNPYPDPHALIAFFHDRTKSYRSKDAILHFLVNAYRKGGEYRQLSSFFLILFTPAIAALYKLGRKQCRDLDEKELIQDICLTLLQIISGTRIARRKVAGRIIGRLKNEMQDMFKKKASKSVADLDDSRNMPFPGMIDGDNEDFIGDLLELLDIAGAEAFLDDLVRARVIDSEDRKIIMTSVIRNKPMKDMAKSAADLERIRRRRSRSFAAIRNHIDNLLKSKSK